MGYKQDGYRMGYLDSYRIDSAGTVIGIFTNGLANNIAQIAVATFNNPAGLEKMGETMFRTSSNSRRSADQHFGDRRCGDGDPGSLGDVQRRSFAGVYRYDRDATGDSRRTRGLSRLPMRCYKSWLTSNGNVS